MDDGKETDAGGLVQAGRKHHFTFDVGSRLTEHLDFGLQTGPADDQRTTPLYEPNGWETYRKLEQRDSAGVWSPQQITEQSYYSNGLLRTLVTKNGTGTLTHEQHTLEYLDAAGVYLNGHRTKDAFLLKGPTNIDCASVVCAATFRYDGQERLTQHISGHGVT